MTKPLTPKQEAFAQAVASGLTQSDAYRKAYTVGVNTKHETINQTSCRLMADPNIYARVETLKGELSKKGLWSREDSVRALLSVLDDPDKKTDIIAAVKELNSMHGFNEPQKVDHTSSDNSMSPKPAIELDAKMVKSILEKISADI